jgi:hypothetical protein
LIDEQEFINLFASFEPVFLESLGAKLRTLRRIRPGWLGRKGYVVFYLGSAAKKQILERIAPLQKHHGKWEQAIDMKALEDFAHSSEVMNNIFYPSILHELAADRSDDVIMAGRVRGRHKPRVMPLGLIKAPRPFWIRLDKLSQCMLGISNTLTIDCLKLLLPGEAWAQIHEELHLDEIGIERE